MQEYEIQQVVDYFKEWLPKATQELKQRLKRAAQQEADAQREKLRREREEEEKRLRVKRSIKI